MTPGEEWIDGRMSTREPAPVVMLHCAVCRYWVLESYWESHLEVYHRGALEQGRLL